MLSLVGNNATAGGEGRFSHAALSQEYSGVWGTRCHATQHAFHAMRAMLLPTRERLIVEEPLLR